MGYTSIIYTCIFLIVSACGSIAQETETQQSPYTLRRGDPSGIGKWHMGREIAHVMGYQGISWLERPEREKEEQASLLLKNMEIQPGDHIADIGAGSGYHVFKMAELAQIGQVYAVDIQDEMLNAMRQKAKSANVTNVQFVKGSEKNVNLPANSVDKLLMVDVYHEFSFPIEMLSSIKKALKPDGKIYLIEYRAEDRTVPIKRLHKMSEAQAKKEFEASGFELQENIGNLPWQHCLVFGHK